MPAQGGSTLKALAVGFLSLILTCIAVPILRWVAMRWDFVDRPDGPMKPQVRAIPYGGGIAVAIGLASALLLVQRGLPTIPAIGAVMVSVLGFVDDAVGVRPFARLVLGLLAGSTLLVLCPFAASSWSGAVLAGICTAILASASMNACNMTDGSDGLSGTVGLLAVGGLLVGWLLAGEVVLAEIAAASCGSIVGFLVFNWPPARVYLGDSGAYLMGFLLTGLCVPALLSWHAIVGVICIMVLLELELLASVMRRALARQGLVKGDRRHIYDVLRLRFRQSAIRVDVLYGLVGLVSSGIGVLVWRGASVIIGIIWIVFLSGAVVVLYRKSGSGKVV